ncbi:hypothetical protein J6590_011068 [Homalodisca vitripennis]|nr:hypothetical protein J6590_011068 [Homalodisca vitripennis]
MNYTTGTRTARKPHVVFFGCIQLCVVGVSTDLQAVKVGKNSPRCAVNGTMEHLAFSYRNTNRSLTRDFAFLATLRIQYVKTQFLPILSACRPRRQPLIPACFCGLERVPLYYIIRWSRHCFSDTLPPGDCDCN